MERSMRLLSIVFLSLLLFVSTGPMMAAEASICESPSDRFTGICVLDANCEAVCKTEGLSGGHCRDFACFCTKSC